MYITRNSWASDCRKMKMLWAKDIYAESAMGCTGPLVLVSDANEEKAKTLLREAGYIG